jgi:hypothetical protein
MTSPNTPHTSQSFSARDRTVSTATQLNFNAIVVALSMTHTTELLCSHWLNSNSASAGLNQYEQSSSVVCIMLRETAVALKLSLPLIVAPVQTLPKSWETRVRFLAGPDSFLRYNVQTGPGVHPLFNPVRTGFLPSRLKRPMA